jgi:hypothetical protein
MGNSNSLKPILSANDKKVQKQIDQLQKSIDQLQTLFSKKTSSPKATPATKLAR